MNVTVAIVAGLLALCAGQYIKSQGDQLEAAQGAITQAKKETKGRDEIISNLLKKKRRNDAARKELETQQTGIRATLATRESMIRKLQNENAELRAWAAVSLPDAVVRLHQHGQITGAAAYRERVLQGAAVQPAGGGRAD